MINDISKWLFRTSLIAIFWVFALSISIKGQPLFNYANDFFVQNELVRFVDRQLGELWTKVSDTARITFSDDTRDKKVF